MAAKIESGSTFIDIRMHSLPLESKEEVKEQKEEKKEENKDELTNLYDKIPSGIPYKRPEPISCCTSLWSKISCCFLPECCDDSHTYRLVRELNSALECEDIKKATDIYDRGIRWNTNPILKSSNGSCTDPEPFKLQSAIDLILGLSSKKKMSSLFWLIKHSTISHSSIWIAPTDLLGHDWEDNDVHHFWDSWYNNDTDFIGHAIVRALCITLHDLGSSDFTKTETRHSLLSAYLKCYPYETLPKERRAFKRDFNLSLQVSTDKFMNLLLESHFCFAVDHQEYSIIDLFLKKPGKKGLDVNECNYISYPAGRLSSQHFAFYAIDSYDEMKFWISKGLDPNKTRLLHEKYETLLWAAMVKKNKKVIDLLVKHGAKMKPSESECVKSVLKLHDT